MRIVLVKLNTMNILNNIEKMMNQVDYDRKQIFDQFDFFFDTIIEKHKTPKAICGYIVMAMSSFIGIN